MSLMSEVAFVALMRLRTQQRRQGEVLRITVLGGRPVSPLFDAETYLGT